MIKSPLFIVLLVCAPVVQATGFWEVFTVLSRYVKNPSQVGEVAPMSSSVASELARFVGASKGPAKRYLEAGGGCGAVSVCLAAALRPEDHLDVIEIDEVMCEMLEQRLQEYPNVSVHCCSILDWDFTDGYDGIISTLPFNSLGFEFSEKVIEYFKKAARRDCVFSYVEYKIVKHALQYFYTSDNRKNFQVTQDFLQQLRDQFLIEHTTVYFNVPPTTIYHLCFQK